MKLIRALLIAMCLINLAHAAPVGTQFTYQGKLQDNGVPANGLYDFEFRLFDALVNGNPVGSVLTANDIPVENGVFSVELNFGAFGSEARWLAIAVREGSSVGAYDPLTPRQSITATPVAQFALAGNPGPQGPSGVVQIASLAGSIPAIVSPGMATPPWVFAGPFTTVTVSAGQRITGSGSGSFGHNSNSTVTASVSLCISNNVAGATLEPFHPMNFLDATVLAQPNKTLLSANGSRVVTQAGTYRVGFCVRNKSTVINLASNDFVNAWFMVTN
ncbi:MAG: hypothetical protein AB7E72_03945 [Lysobacterales bacterium]